MVNARQQKSRKIRRDWIQVDALCCGTGWDEEDLGKPQILVEDVFGSSHPGSIHLNELAEEASLGVFQEGGKPAQFHGTDICDGWAMLHSGMNYILPSREIISDLVEVHASYDQGWYLHVLAKQPPINRMPWLDGRVY